MICRNKIYHIIVYYIITYYNILMVFKSNSALVKYRLHLYNTYYTQHFTDMLIIIPPVILALCLLPTRNRRRY